MLTDAGAGSGAGAEAGAGAGAGAGAQTSPRILLRPVGSSGSPAMSPEMLELVQ